jgi:hypothetical protein
MGSFYRPETSRKVREFFIRLDFPVDLLLDFRVPRTHRGLPGKELVFPLVFRVKFRAEFNWRSISRFLLFLPQGWPWSRRIWENLPERSEMRSLRLLLTSRLCLSNPHKRRNCFSPFLSHSGRPRTTTRADSPGSEADTG